MHLPELIHQKSSEQVRYVLRRHPLTFLPKAGLFLLLLIVPVVTIWLLHNFFSAFIASPVPRAALILGVSGYLLLIYVLFFFLFVDYYLDMWIVTNDRIVDIDQLGLFNRTISELDLFRIQDVTTQVKGIFATFFDYGNVNIKTASSNLDIVFYNVPHPNKIRETLLDLADGNRKFHYGEAKDKGENEM